MPATAPDVVDQWLVAARLDQARTGVFLDFDGTLSPIVDDPAAAEPAPGVTGSLNDLAERVGRLAVVSGRPVAYLNARLAGVHPEIELLGLYGLERKRRGSQQVLTHPDGERWRLVVERVARDAPAEMPPGTLVEPKGLTVTLHYRHAPSSGPAVEELARRLADKHGLVAHGGKMSVELRPPLDVDKGTVVRDRAAGFAAVLFAGDDRGDVPAFDVLAEMRRSGVTTLAVASGGDETPAALVGKADHVVDGPVGVVRLLRRLIAGLPPLAGG